MTNAAAATTQSVPTTTVRGARDDCRFATRDRLVPDAEGFDALVRSWRRDDFTRSTNVRNVVRRAGRFLFPLFEGTTIPPRACPPRRIAQRWDVFAIGHQTAKALPGWLWCVESGT